MAVGIIGLGYVGLPLVVAFAEAGERIIAVDTDERKIALLTAGQSYVEDVPPSACARCSPRSTRPVTTRRSPAPTQ